MIAINGVKIDSQIILQKFNFPIEGICFQDKKNFTISWFYENENELFVLYCLKRHLDNVFNHPNITLYVPYIPYGNMGYSSLEEDVFVLKYFCEIINSLHFAEVQVYDANNFVMMLLNNAANFSVEHYLRKTLVMSGAEVVVFPNETSMKHYSPYIKIPYTIGIKKENEREYNIISPQDVVGKDVLIIDNFYSSDNNFINLAKALRKAGAKRIFLYITHLETINMTGELFDSKLIDCIYTMDSVFSQEKLDKNWISIIG